MLAGMDDEPMARPSTGMTISVRTRQDVVVMDPERFMAAARRAYRADDPQITEDQAAAQVSNVHEAVFALMDRYGALASDHPDVATGGTAVRRMSGGLGVMPGERVRDRPDGLSPAGSISCVVLDEPQPLQDYGCFLPEDAELFSSRLAP